MHRNLSTRVLGEEDHQRWTQLVCASPDGSVYSLPQYLSTLCEATGGRFRVLAVERGEELVGGIALYEERSRWGAQVSPRPLLHYNGLVLRAETTRYPSERTSRQVEAISALAKAAAELGHARMELRSRSTVRDARPLLAAGWEVTPTYSYVVSLADLEQQWKRVEQNLRRLIERCQREGVTLTDDDDIESFLRLHAGLRQQKGAPVYLADAAFRRYFERLKAAGLCRLYHARLPGGRSISAQLVLLCGHPVAHAAAAAQDAEFRQLGATAFLRWKVFEELRKLGFAANDLTDASLNPVTHFKAQLGGDLELNLLARARPTLAWKVGAALRGSRRRIRSLLRLPGETG